ncbi:PIN domain-containing protein [Candidatus Micrarchaeota archaeon]|nr:PIN domain-containing protein [Candidatus Micrarchaeota archaeon]
MKVLDTSFLVALYLPNDSNYKKAISMASRISDEELLLCDVILFETLTVLKYKATSELCKTAYEELTQNKNIRFFSFTESERTEILKLFLCQTKKLSTADVSLIYLAKKTKCEIVTFDSEILKS